MSPSAYAAWSKDDLIARIQSLEAALIDAPNVTPAMIPRPIHYPRPPDMTNSDGPASFSAVATIPGPLEKSGSHKKMKSKPAKPFDFSSYPRRKIALKFCYSGWEYNGLAFQNEPTPLPMVEAVLLNALEECRLIDPAGGMEGCGWSRCGRTDKGVSAAGQVVALWVRSAVGAGKKRGKAADETARTLEHSDEAPFTSADGALPGPSQGLPSQPASPISSGSALPDPIPQPELRYVNMLNSVLPRSIRILAWSPVSESFDARFSCTYRHYKYFFTPGIPPHPFVASTATNSPSTHSSQLQARLLDIDAMREAASRMVGIHDFRNFAKMDPSKQIENFKREIYEATISRCRMVPYPPSRDTVSHPTGSEAAEDKMYVFDLRGNGFLWHQVRHIMGILFLVGSGLEKPSIIDTLFNTGIDAPDPSLPVVSTKPTYEMADGLPLVLWDCGYKEQDTSWRVDDTISTNPASASNVIEGGGGMIGRASPGTPQHLFPPLHLASQQHLLKYTLLNHFALAATSHHSLPVSPSAAPLGAGTSVQASREKYVKVLDRPRGENVRELNEKWRTGAGARKTARKAAKAENMEGLRIVDSAAKQSS